MTLSLVAPFPPHTSQDESSEEFIGEWMEERGLRDQMVIATKVPSSLPLSRPLFT